MSVSLNEAPSILGKTTFVLAATVLGIGLNFLFTIGLARYLGPEEFGVFAIGLAVFNVASVLSTAGADSAALRYLPALIVKGIPATFWPTVRTLLSYVLLGGLVFGVGLFACRELLAEQVFHDGKLVGVLTGFALAVPFFALSSTLIAVLQSMHIVTWRLVVKYVCEPLAKVGLAVLFLWMGWGLSGAIAGFVSALALTVVLASLPLRAHLAGPNLPSPVSSRMLFDFSTPLLLSLIFSSFGNRSDVLLLGYFAQPSTVGLYSAAFQVASVFALIVQSFESILQPLYSQHLAAADRVGLERVYRSMVRWIGTVVIPLFTVMSLCAPRLLSLYGEAYTEAVWCLTVLALAQCLNSMSAPAHGLLVLAGYSRLVMWNSLAAALLQIALNAALIPSYGILGAAVATGAGLIVVNAARLVQVRRLLNVSPVEPWLWRSGTAAAVAFAAFVVLRAEFEVANVGALLTCFVAMYGLGLFGLGLHDEDRRLLTSLLYKIRMPLRWPMCLRGVMHVE